MKVALKMQKVELIMTKVDVKNSKVAKLFLKSLVQIFPSLFSNKGFRNVMSMIFLKGKQFSMHIDDLYNTL